METPLDIKMVTMIGKNKLIEFVVSIMMTARQ
jgi:hypothetical protein